MESKYLHQYSAIATSTSHIIKLILQDNLKKEPEEFLKESMSLIERLLIETDEGDFKLKSNHTKIEYTHETSNLNLYCILKPFLNDFKNKQKKDKIYEVLIEVWNFLDESLKDTKYILNHEKTAIEYAEFFTNLSRELESSMNNIIYLKEGLKNANSRISV